MATTAIVVDDYKSGDLELLSSGKFSDVEVVCGNRSWKCHGAILVPRCVWFRKALTGPFMEAKMKRVTLVEEDPIGVDLVLKYIYGGGLDIMRSVEKEHFVEQCVSLWHTADYLMLKSLKKAVESAVQGYCDKRMKELFTFPSQHTWRNSQKIKYLSPWAVDLLDGLRRTYEWQISDLKAVLMEFIWIARAVTLQSGVASVLFDHFKDTQTFTDDFLGKYGSSAWCSSSVWRPPRDKVHSTYESGHCLRCSKPITWKDIPGQGQRQILNPFRRDSDNGCRGGWCRDCAAGDNIPWRMERPKRA